MLKFFAQILKVLQYAFYVVIWYLLLELLKTMYCVTLSEFKELQNFIEFKY